MGDLRHHPQVQHLSDVELGGGPRDAGDPGEVAAGERLLKPGVPRDHPRGEGQCPIDDLNQLLLARHGEHRLRLGDTMPNGLIKMEGG